MKFSNNDVLSSHEYVYDAVSNIIARDDNGTVTEFTYDLIDQLLTETKQGYSAEYTYDANGNRLTRTVNSVTEVYEYDDADKLLSVSIGENPVKEYSYDACGRLIAVESSAGVTSLSWDYEDRLIGITYPNQSTNSFGYNPFGARVSKSDSSGTSTYFRAGTSVVSSVLSDGSATYTPGISERRNNNSTYYHSDIKNTTTQTASNETVSGTNQYDAFGNLVNYTGNWNGPFAYGGAFGYKTDDDSGLMLLGHRYYDSSTGRFLSRDPIGDGSNWYAYCGNNPVTRQDSRGLFSGALTGLRIILYEWDEISKKVGGMISNNGANIIRYGLEDYEAKHDKIETGTDGKKRNKNTDCGLFVGECVRPIDPNFPERGTGAQYNYLKESPLWLAVPIVDGEVPRPGDIFIYPPGTKGRKYGHTALISPTIREMEASYGGHSPRSNKLDLDWWIDSGAKRFRYWGPDVTEKN